MILDSGEPIDLSRVFLMLGLSPELMYIDLPAGTSAFDHPKAVAAIEEAVERFPDTVEDYVEHEKEIRRGLCWLLHQPDEALLEIYRTGLDLMLASPSMADQRRLLELLWASGFADWRAKTFDPEAYAVVDGDEGADPPVVLDAVIPIDFSVIFGLLRSSDLDALVGEVEQRPDLENDARLGLSWLLHRDDAVLSDLLDRGGMALPMSSIADRRRHLEMVWDRAFADWRVPGFDQDAYEVVGLSG